MRWLIRNLLYLPPEASTISRDIDNLHFAVIACTMFGATLVFLVALYFQYRYRQNQPGELTPRIHVAGTLEAGLIAGTLALFLGFWVVGFRQYNRMEAAPPGAMDVFVMAKQWMWKFAYPDGRESVGELVVPIGRPVRLIMTSRDVIHSLFVPAFRVKEDVIPGRYVTAWFEATEPGTYDVFCTEYCGTSHSRMRASVIVLTQAEYVRWLERQHEAGIGGSLSAAPHGEIAEQGREVASRRGCFSCHTIDGQRFIGPTWRGLYHATLHLSDGRTIVADEAYLTRSMMDPTVDVVGGFASVMPTYRGILEPAEVGALVEFIRSLEFAGPAPSVALPPIADGGVGIPIRPVTAPYAGAEAERETRGEGRITSRYQAGGETLQHVVAAPADASIRAVLPLTEPLLGTPAAPSAPRPTE